MACTGDKQDQQWTGSAEVWTDEEDGSSTYSHTSAVARAGNDFLYAETRVRGDDMTMRMHWPAMRANPIPRDEIYPVSADDAGLYALWRRGTTTLAQQFFAEVRIFEILVGLRHPNLACYHGCILDGGRIVAIVLSRCQCTLKDRLASMDLQLRRRCLSSVRAGIQQLHEIGLAHNDLNPRNIMFDHDDTAIIIDYDSCAIEGTPLRKLGTPDWNNGMANVSSFGNDVMCLRQLEEELVTSYQDELSAHIPKRRA